MAHPECRVRDILSTDVLRNIANLDSAAVLRGQPVASRRSTRRRFPSVEFYQHPWDRQDGFPGHRQAFGEIATVLRGSLNFIIGNRVYRARAGDWIVVEPDVYHGECCVVDRKPYRMLWFVPNGPYLSVHVSAFRSSTGYRLVGTESTCRMPPAIGRTLSELCTQPWQPSLQAKRLLVQLLGWGLENLGAFQPKSDRGVHPTIGEVLDILDACQHRLPSVGALADQVGVTPNYLSYLFHREVGQTIRRYTAKLRIQRAQHLLADPTLSLKQIAYQLGFADPPHFSHAFRRATGMSPTAYRRQIGG